MSRNKNTARYTSTLRGGRELELLKPRQPGLGVSRALHTVKPGERLDTISWAYYRDPNQGWRIVEANPVLDPDELLEPGQILAIPEL